MGDGERLINHITELTRHYKPDPSRSDCFMDRFSWTAFMDRFFWAVSTASSIFAAAGFLKTRAVILMVPGKIVASPIAFASKSLVEAHVARSMAAARPPRASHTARAAAAAPL